LSKYRKVSALRNRDIVSIILSSIMLILMLSSIVLGYSLPKIIYYIIDGVVAALAIMLIIRSANLHSNNKQ
jgi:TRAP-type uncharacterized transport system fused permease subunit